MDCSRFELSVECGPKPECYPPRMQCCPESSYALKPCQSRELRGSVLYTSCDCPKRNGLADDCKRRECGGRTECMTVPNPICCPSKFYYRYSNMAMGKPSASRSTQNSAQKLSCFAKQAERCPKLMNAGRHCPKQIPAACDPVRKIKKEFSCGPPPTPAAASCPLRKLKKNLICFEL